MAVNNRVKRFEVEGNTGLKTKPGRGGKPILKAETDLEVVRENGCLAQSLIVPEENITVESKSKSRKRAKSVFRAFFDTQKLKIGDKVFFKPAIDNGYDKNSPQISAETVNLGDNCLRRQDENMTYSFSKLRKIITKELNLDIKAN